MAHSFLIGEKPLLLIDVTEDPWVAVGVGHTQSVRMLGISQRRGFVQR